MKKVKDSVFLRKMEISSILIPLLKALKQKKKKKKKLIIVRVNIVKVVNQAKIVIQILKQTQNQILYQYQ